MYIIIARFHDFLNIESEEAQMIKDADALYSKGSRLASEVINALSIFLFFRYLNQANIPSH